MQFYFAVANKTMKKSFGKIVRGLRYKDERPMVCYISPEELEKHARSTANLAAYLHQIQMGLAVGGRIEIKSA